MREMTIDVIMVGISSAIPLVMGVPGLVSKPNVVIYHYLISTAPVRGGGDALLF